MTHVVSVGDVMIDVVARLSGPLAPGSDKPAPITLHGGGAAANVAAWLVPAGARATFVGRVGSDDFGRRAVDDLTAAGVTAAVDVDPVRPTGTCIVLIDPDGERTMVPHPGANAGLGELDARALLPPAADWLYLSGYALLDGGSRPFALAALRHAREQGWAIAVDAASAAPLARAGATTFLGWLGADVLLFANEDEANTLTGTHAATAASILAARVGRAVVKSGAAGAVWSDGTSTVSSEAVAAVMVDSTGAGDAFAAGFLAAGGEVHERLVAAARLAARAVAVVGGRPGQLRHTRGS